MHDHKTQSEAARKRSVNKSSLFIKMTCNKKREIFYLKIMLELKVQLTLVITP